MANDKEVWLTFFADCYIQFLIINYQLSIINYLKHIGRIGRLEFSGRDRAG